MRHFCLPGYKFVFLCGFAHNLHLQPSGILWFNYKNLKTTLNIQKSIYEKILFSA